MALAWNRLSPSLSRPSIDFNRCHDLIGMHSSHIHDEAHMYIHAWQADTCHIGPVVPPAAVVRIGESPDLNQVCVWCKTKWAGIRFLACVPREHS